MLVHIYDSANQLIREDNRAEGKTWTWEYDAGGNILNKKEYAYTTGDIAETVTPEDTIAYDCGDGAWGDLLVSFDGETIEYDEIGNPLTDGTKKKYLANHEVWKEACNQPNKNKGAGFGVGTF